MKKEFAPDHNAECFSEVSSDRLRFNEEILTLLLDISPAEVDMEKVRNEAAKMNLNPKRELHLTLIGRQTGEDIIKMLEEKDDTQKIAILDELKILFISIKWQYSLSSKYYYIAKEYPVSDGGERDFRESIVMLADIVGIKEFYQRLNGLLGTNFDVPFPHLTLYTNGTREDKRLRGIGVYSEKDFADLKPQQIAS